MKLGAAVLLVLASCSSGRPNQERLGDAAWHDGRWADAVADYRGAGDSPRLLAKRADAAFQGGQLAEAAQAWTALGVAAPGRVGEAAAGLARTASAADHAGDQHALALAILGLHQVAPGWPLGRLAVRFARTSDLPMADAVQILPAALAAVSGHSAADPLLVAMGHAERAGGACTRAVPTLEGVLRRGPSAALRDSATTDLKWCELTLGLAALRAARPGEAERWLDRAARLDPDGAVGRRALIAFGDVRASEGDLVSATIAWQSIASMHVPPDSITQLALDRLRPPAPPDSSQAPPGHP